MRMLAIALAALGVAACASYPPEVPMTNPPKVVMTGIKKAVYEADLTDCDRLASEEIHKVDLFARHWRRTLALYQGPEGDPDNPESPAGRRRFAAACLVQLGYRLDRS